MFEVSREEGLRETRIPRPVHIAETFWEGGRDILSPIFFSFFGERFLTSKISPLVLSHSWVHPTHPPPPELLHEGSSMVRGHVRHSHGSSPPGMVGTRLRREGNCSDHLGTDKIISQVIARGSLGTRLSKG